MRIHMRYLRSARQFQLFLSELYNDLSEFIYSIFLEYSNNFLLFVRLRPITNELEVFIRRFPKQREE